MRLGSNPRNKENASRCSHARRGHSSRPLSHGHCCLPYRPPVVLALPDVVADRVVLSSLFDIVADLATVGDDVHSPKELL